jgi:hypothetical protein
MTGNQIKGKGFRGALRYNLEKVEKGIAEILEHSFASTAEKTILTEIQMVRIQRPNLKKFFYHTSINFPPGEDLPNDKMKQIGLDYLEANGFTQYQYIMCRHYDADHPHLHILVNRIGYDGSVLSDSNDYSRSEKILRDLEKKYNLTQVPSSTQARQRAVTKDELEMMKRTNTPSHKIQLQAIIRHVLTQKPKPNTREFIKALERKKVKVLFNQASTGYVSGISYSYDGLTITGANLGNDFKWASIKSSIDYDQQRDQQIIQQTNERTKKLGPGTQNRSASNSKYKFKKTSRGLTTFRDRESMGAFLESLLSHHLNLLLGQPDLQHDHTTDDFIKRLKRKSKEKKEKIGLANYSAWLLFLFFESWIGFFVFTSPESSSVRRIA